MKLYILTSRFEQFGVLCMAKPRLTAVEGNRQKLDGGAMFGNAPRALWQRWYQPDELGRIELSCRAMLIEYDSLKILCETGIGAYMAPDLKERFGVFESQHRLLENLQKSGLRHQDIDIVILSHLHFDHAGGLLSAYDGTVESSPELLFPKARFVVGREAFARAEHPHARDRASFIPGLTEKLRATGRLTLVDGDRLPGVLEDRLRFHYTSGHTPGHMHTVFRGDEFTVIFAGDLIPGTAWINTPITMGYDRFPEQLIDEKEALYHDVIAQGWHLFLTHDPKVSLVSIQRDAKGKMGVKESWEDVTSLNF